MLVRGPCWCKDKNGKSNNGKKVNLWEYLRPCNNVKGGGSHDKYELPFQGIIPEIEEGTCDKCLDLRKKAQEKKWEEEQRAQIEEARRVAEERAAQVAAQGDNQGDNQEEHQGEHQGGYQENNQGGYQGEY
ncbi:uncharacterized protein EAE98_005362 [Botrytis deweyae]|uniref:Stc1 domain-containing protein n=1 Tax=Botrytis deweyae TaxID=2478750 RepID=A0ABQ7IPJ9_9HELO|nr:uncharacterized protein EAE98_005362 [Botrytis deweyae]KAF7929444.1 hypothetical protein EAE98_005362 [Botrytis deweyae]